MAFSSTLRVGLGTCAHRKICPKTRKSCGAVAVAGETLEAHLLGQLHGITGFLHARAPWIQGPKRRSVKRLESPRQLRHCSRTSILSGCLPFGLSQAECIKLAEPSTSRTCWRLLAQRAFLPGSFGAAACQERRQTTSFGARNSFPFFSWPSPGFGRLEIFSEQARMVGIFLCTFIRRPFAAVFPLGSAANPCKSHTASQLLKPIA